MPLARTGGYFRLLCPEPSVLNRKRRTISKPAVRTFAGGHLTSTPELSPSVYLSRRHLLDVNVLVAWGWSDHVEHERTVTWIAAVRKQKATILLMSAIPELGFVRISVQRTEGLVTVKEASKTLAGMVTSLGVRHGFLVDDRRASDFPEWCHHASRTTDAHLLQLAEAHGAKLVTLDSGIPGAFLVPALAAKG